MSEFVKQVYMDYFGKPIEIDIKLWMPNLVCESCVKYLRFWANKKYLYFSLEVIMIWCEQSNHHDDCYSNFANITGVNSKNRIAPSKLDHSKLSR